MDYTNIPLGLRVQTQIPLDTKTYIESENTLKDLGLNNNLAFVYQKGLIVYCIQEGTRYEWKEIEIGEIGLLPNNFIYPSNIITFGIDYSNKIYNFVKISDTTNIIAGTNIMINGNGTEGNPYIITNTLDGSETKLVGSDKITIIGNGTIENPYIINTTINGSETKILAGSHTTVIGSGTTDSPYVISAIFDGAETKMTNSNTTIIQGSGTLGQPYKVEVKKKQKVLTYPTDFPGGNYTLTNLDDEFLIFINNDITNVNIIIPSGLLDSFFVAFIQDGTADVQFINSGTALLSRNGFKIKDRYSAVALDKRADTPIFYLTGNTKI